MPIENKKKICYIASPMKKLFLSIIFILVLTSALSVEKIETHIFAMGKTATPNAQQSKTVKNDKNITQEEIISLFENRRIEKPTPFNFIGYEVQQSIRAGVPVNTIMLILLMPLLATVVAFFRHVVGINSLGIIVPVALSITLVSTGLSAGVIFLMVIIVSSVFARILFRKIRIMQLSKVSLSLLVVAIFIFITLTVGATSHLLTESQSAIFPVLMLILLSERLLGVQMERSPREVMQIIILTLGVSILGYLLLSSRTVRNIVLLYPETVLLVIPVNIITGRYFGLRITEYFRFGKVIKNGSH